MTTENYLILSVCLSALFPIFLGISFLISTISDVIKEHLYDRRFNSEPYTVKDAKHLFCELYKNASEYEVFESVDSNVFAVIRKEFIEKDFDKPIDDEE